MAHVQVENVDATASLAKKLGGKVYKESGVRVAPGSRHHLTRVPFTSKLGSHFDPSVEYSHLLVMVSPEIVVVPRSLSAFPPTTLSAVHVYVVPFTVPLIEPEFPKLSKKRDV